MAELTDKAVYRGRAQLAGIPGSFDVILYKVQQKATLNHSFDKKVTLDQWGQDVAWRGTNEKIDADWEMKLIGRANSETRANVITGAAFLGPLAVVTLSSFDLTWLNTTWLHDSGTGINLMNDDVGTNTIKLFRYVNADQNSLAATTPT